MHQQEPQLKPKKKGFNPLLFLPVIGAVGIAIALVCAAGFAVYAIFFYEPEGSPVAEAGATATPTFEIVEFGNNQAEGEATPQPGEAGSGGETPPQEGETAPSEGGGQQPAQPPAEPGAQSVAPVINNAPVTMSSPDYGMQVFLFWQEEIADRDLQLVQDAGFPWVKQEFAWRESRGRKRRVRLEPH